MSPSGVQLNKTAAVVIIGIIVTVIIVYKMVDRGRDFKEKDIPVPSSWKSGPYEDLPAEKMEAAASIKPKTNTVMVKASGQIKEQENPVPSSWKLGPYEDLPPKKMKEAASITPKTNAVTVKASGQEFKIFYRETGQDSKSLPVLFLHGMKFTSKNWEDIKTLQLVAALGYRGVAVDLPVYGDSKADKEPADYAVFMEALISALNMKAPVIVSPSMSGRYSLPYLCKDPSKVLERSRGFIPVAPTGPKEYADIYRDLKVPTVIVWGEKDKTLGAESAKYFQNLPNNERFEIKGAGHPAYLDKPEEWHKIVYNFLDAIEKRPAM